MVKHQGSSRRRFFRVYIHELFW